ncbi:aldehyde dehydrogenase family protein [Ramlibacter humi]|uniref:4-(hydroxymethyl)benzenesulfonate dehydrogenase n=1 Tax=Ramlibacter humi TaxID=2530451 RepID=A0A4Z0BBQ8_9BURK|nr:aldehyde dehydrogenase family protein [Ramlibacter humi]TFY96606.1 aldehyde dehydrogenase [Ramlibacter humi]
MDRLTHFDPAEVAVPSGHWVGGRELDDGVAALDVTRPSDGTVHARVMEAGAGVVRAAVASALAGQQAWAKLRPRERAQRMRRWADLVDRDRDRLARLEAVVSSRCFHEARGADVPAVAEWLRFYAEYADKLEGQVTASGDDRLSLVLREPYGVVGVITPWNFPLFLATWKLAPAIAAGNAVVVKASELTPWSVQALAQLATEAGLPDGVINVVHGTGPVTGQALVKDPDVAYVTFTGSTATGARIMADAAAANIKPVALELGGKSATVVHADCGELDLVADHVTWSITRNAGQLCYAGSRLVVDERVADDLLARIASRMRELVAGPTWSPGTSMPPIISERQWRRIDELVRRTVDEGASLVCGGQPSRQQAGCYYPGTILDRVQPGMTGHREEIFGPVLAVQRFGAPEDALKLANHPVYGLSAAVFTRDVNTALHAARGLKAGTVWVNRWGRTPEMMTSPFGGYGQSGFGKESGRAGIENFLRSKSVWIDLADKAEMSQGGRR